MKRWKVGKRYWPSWALGGTLIVLFLVQLLISPHAVQAAPIAVSDSFTTAEDTVLVIAAPGVLANDTSIEGPSLQAILGSGPSHGTVILNRDGSFRYTPQSNYNGSDSFRYSVWDGARQSSTVAVNLTVTPVNDAPTDITLFGGTVPENVPLGTQIGWFTTQDPETTTGFTYALSGEGAEVLEMFNVNYVRTKAGLDYETKRAYALRVRTTDSGGLSYEHDFVITVTNVNEAPTAVDDSYTPTEDMAMIVLVPGVMANDSDADRDSLIARLLTGPVCGTLTLQANGSFTYVPVGDYCGSDAFTYEAWDGFLASAPAMVSLMVVSVNDLPSFTKGADQTVLEDCGVQTVPGWATSISAGPPDESGQTLTFTVTNDNNSLFSTQPFVAPDGTLIYIPAADKNGSATVIVHIQDNGGVVNGGVDTSADQTFAITVTPVNDPPVNTALPAISGIPHVGRTLTATDGVWDDLIDTSVSGTSVLSYTYQWQRSTDGGSNFAPIAGAISSSYLLTLPDNLQQVRVQVTCSDSGVGQPVPQSTAVFSLPIPMTILNAAPVITEGPAVSMSCDEDESPVALMLVLHATDPDALDTLTWHVVTPPAQGSLTLPAPSVGSSTACWVYHPAHNWNGTDTFTLRVEDGLTGEDEITGTVTVNPRNDAPVNTVRPGIAGNLFVNHEVRAMIGSWNDAIDTDVSGMSVLSYTHQWLRARDAEGTGLALISGAIVSSYVVSPMDEGMYLAVRVTCTDGGVGLPASVSTSVDSAFLPARYLDTMPPTIELPHFSSWPGVTSCSGDTTLSFTVTDASFVLPFTVGDDRLGGVQLSISVGGRALSAAQCTDSSTRALPLVEGPNDVQITAVDAAGNMSTRHLSITLDTHAPAVTLATRPPLATTSSVLTIAGSVRDNFSSVRFLSVDGIPVIPYVDGTFRCELSLKKGENTVRIAAADSAGNSGSETYDVTYTPASPSPVSGHTIVLTIGSKTMSVDGARIALDTRVALVDDRTLLPLRAVVEHLGGSIAWNARTRQVTLKVRGTTIVLTIGKNSALVNGKPLAIDAKNSKVVPLISSGCTMLPLRFVAENLGLKVGWNAKTKAVTLTWDD